MHIDQLKAFIEITRCGNFKHAAEALFVTQSTVTMRIKTLETQLGQSLFVRNKKGAELTVAGRQFLAYAKQMLLTWRQANQALSLPSNLQSVLQLGVETALYDSFLRLALLPLKHALPQLAWQLQERATSSLLTALQDVRLHWVIGLEQGRHHDLHSVPIGSQRLVLVSTVARAVSRWDERFIHVEWGGDYRARYAEHYPYDQTPSVTLPAQSDLVSFLCRHQGSAYLPEAWVGDALREARLFLVHDAPVFERNIVLYCHQRQAQDEDFERARRCLAHWGHNAA